MRLNLKKFDKTLLIIVAMTVLFGCQKSTDGPYFGNGFHNGWADQHTIVLWTRLTKNPELNADGQKFLVPSAEEHKELDKSANAKRIYGAQIPEGLTLDQMEGACPGSPGEVKLTYYPLANIEKNQETEWVAVDADKNFTHQWNLDELEAGTKYVVKIEARKDDKSKISDLVQGAFRTPYEANIEQDIDFCVVTCHDYIRKDSSNGHKIYDAMLHMFPDFYVHTGDIEYYDKPGPYAMTEELMRFKWDRLFALPLQRTFFNQVTSYFIKDDHDALKNDAFPEETYGTVSWERGLEIFDKEQFPSNDKPYKTVRWGKDLQIWLVEGRNFRSKNTDQDGSEKTIWGKEQKEWFYKTIEESDATFKVLMISDPILGPDRAKGKNDNHSNLSFKHEGDELREFINQHDNIYICNGDRHWQYVTHFEGTNLWEFSCGAGSDSHAGGWKKGDKRAEHRFLRVKGGFLKGNVSRSSGKPTLTFQHYDVDGNVVHEEVFEKEN